MSIGNFINKFGNSFTDTVFYKHDSELQYQINALKELLRQHPENNELQKKLKLCEWGSSGEKEIEFELKNANIGMYVLHDVNIEFQDLKAQIDYIIITPAKLYFVECKNLVGNIIIDNRGNFIREYNYGNFKKKEGVYSPVTQAKRHVEVFKKIWKSRNTSFLDKAIRSKNLDNWYVPLVVLSNSKCIINDKYAPKEVRNILIKSDQLVDYLKKDIEYTDKDLLYNQKELHDIAYSIMQNYNKEIERDYEVKYSNDLLKSESSSQLLINNNVKQNLLNYRKSKSKEKNIPAYYIFTNEELDRMISLMPKNKQQLADAKILTDVKLRLHGDEIINILNKK